MNHTKSIGWGVQDQQNHGRPPAPRPYGQDGMRRARHLCAMLLWLALMCLQGACAGERAVFGTIPVDTFQFTTVVKDDGRGKAGGWQVAQVVILLGRLSYMFPRASSCDIEVGVPIRSRKHGYITVEHAQLESATASDKAAHDILTRREKPTATICELFRKSMRYYLADQKIGTIPGARVTGFVNNWIVPRRSFPPRRGR